MQVAIEFVDERFIVLNTIYTTSYHLTMRTLNKLIQKQLGYGVDYLLLINDNGPRALRSVNEIRDCVTVFPPAPRLLTKSPASKLAAQLPAPKPLPKPVTKPPTLKPPPKPAMKEVEGYIPITVDAKRRPVTSEKTYIILTKHEIGSRFCVTHRMSEKEARALFKRYIARDPAQGLVVVECAIHLKTKHLKLDGYKILDSFENESLQVFGP